MRIFYKHVECNEQHICLPKKQVGQGRACFDAAKAALQSWQHMSLGWVGTNKPEIRVGSGVCIIAKMLCFWQRNPLQIVYVNERKRRFWQQSAVKQLSRQEGGAAHLKSNKIAALRLPIPCY